MCRIVGVAGYGPRGESVKASVSAMTDELAHGGPDDGGIYTDDENAVCMGHRRLSILDLSASGHQPMSDVSGKIWISYNGEVYNFREIREELAASGFRFRSETDTEVIIYAYEKWGECAFEKLNGMFSFCLYDAKKTLLYLVRDHAGIKPLYYSLRNGTLVFASETKSFRTLDAKWEDSQEWRIYMLLFGHIPEPYTTLRDVFMLPRGSFMKYDLISGSYEVSGFEDYAFTNEIHDAVQAEENIRAVFGESVKRHLISDAPIGVFLSGGIDSSLVALLAAKHEGDALRTLSVVFNEEEYSEENFQRSVLQNISSTHKSCLVTEKDFMDSLDDIFRAMDQPTTDGVNTYFISRCAHEEGLKAVLSGVGGDELFGGYPSFRWVDRIWPLRRFSPALRDAFKLFEHAPGERIKKFSFLALSDPAAFYLFFRGFFPVGTVSRILGVSGQEVADAIEKLYDGFPRGLSKKDYTTMIETDMYMKNQLLRDTDFMSMRHSLEVRVPFLDKEFMKLVFSISPDLKFGSGSQKPLLVKSFGDILPRSIVDRKKQGFSFPFQLWMKNNIDTLKSCIRDKDNPAVSGIIDSFANNRLHWSRFWSLVVLGRKCAA